jgi:hypothetical protein
MVNLQMIPIFIPSGGGPMTDSDVKIMLGIWIVLNTLWVISWLISVVKYVLKRKRGGYYGFRWDGEWDLLLIYFDVVMVIIWVAIILYWLGSLVANLL